MASSSAPEGISSKDVTINDIESRGQSQGDLSATPPLQQHQRSDDVPDKAVSAKHRSFWPAFHPNDSVAHNNATLALAWMSMLTGLIDGLIYSRTSVWVGFQTGNIVTFSLGIADFIYPWATAKPRLLTLMRFCSFASFFVASWLGNAAIARKWFSSSSSKSQVGHATRWWLFVNSMFQALLLFAAAGILWSRPEDEQPTFEWFPPVIVLVAFSMGLQSLLSQKLSSPVFSTSVAFTATLTQLASDPHLFTPRLSFIGSHKEVKGRDLRLFALASLALGGGLAQTLLDSDAGLRGGMTVAAAFKVVLAGLWWISKGSAS